MKRVKKCYACGQTLPVESFTKNKTKKDGLADECRVCKKISDAKSHLKNREKRLAKMKEYQKEHREELRVKSIEYSRSEKGRKNNLKATRKYYQKHKKEIVVRMHENNQGKNHNKYIARNQAKNAIRLGKLVRPRQCEGCRKEGLVEAHHPDYTKPLDVKWLCKKCHNFLNRKAETL